MGMEKVDNFVVKMCLLSCCSPYTLIHQSLQRWDPFYLFPKTEIRLRGRHFRSVEEIIDAVQTAAQDATFPLRRDI